jgi:sterol carrier protein 2
LTRAIVAGVGMIPFKKPYAANVYVAMGSEAARRALADAGLAYTNIQQAYVGYVYGDSTCGQRALYEIGLSGAPIINVNNNCSTGSTALYLARQAIESGAVDCVLQRRLCPKRSDRPVGPAIGQDGEAAQRNPASPRFRAARYW